jgi:nucleolar protein 56
MGKNLKELRKKALKKTREKVKKELFKRDKLVVQAIDAIDELDSAANLVIERVRNWYSLHFPELERMLAKRDIDAYLKVVAEGKGRKGIKDEKMAMVAKQSMGADIAQEDLEAVAELAKLALEMRKERERCAKYVESLVREVAPNASAVAGEMLAARLIALAGSLKRLAEFPSSTVQVLGAEKALFAHLKSGVKPPKHGVIFAFPAIRQAPKKLRGKISRLVANKISIAARMDYFGHEDEGKKLRKELDEKVEEILEGS